MEEVKAQAADQAARDSQTIQVGKPDFSRM